MTRLFLIGYMGAGKTTLGKAYARFQGLQFIDLDKYLEARRRKSVSAIFHDEGESGFRRTESSLLHEVGEFEDVVVATGGGTPCFYDNMEYMNRQGTTVFLDTSMDVLFRRLSVSRTCRPLLDGMANDELRRFMSQQLLQRSPSYRKAKLTFRGDELENREQITRSVELLHQLLQNG
ncbi:MAG: shikimate kinase [Bacteroidales bacterium]|nr:shikimate kinase [Bacteroidales bacterium]